MADTPEQLEIKTEPAGTTPAAPVSSASPQALEAISAEFNRRFGAMDDRLNTVVQYIASKEQPPPPPPSSTDATDPLWQRAQQGDKKAFDEWVGNKTRETIAEQQRWQSDESITDGQLNILLRRYPAFNDASHPLTQSANLAFQLMVKNGKPATKATLLDAAKTAIADRPEIVAQMHASTARERSRQGSVRVGQGQMGAGYREPEPGQLPSGRKPRLTPESFALAKRMGISTPERALKAKENFLKRQEEGQSSLGAVAAFVREDDF
jgi:hypothetical protein